LESEADTPESLDFNFADLNLVEVSPPEVLQNKNSKDALALLESLKLNYKSFLEKIGNNQILTIRLRDGLTINNRDFESYYCWLEEQQNLSQKLKTDKATKGPSFDVYPKPKLFNADWA
jgi:hypothetical protein